LSAVFGTPSIELSDRQVQWFAITRDKALKEAKEKGIDVGPKDTTEGLIEEQTELMIECFKALIQAILSKPSF
jgi:hypothetical protein